MAILYGIESDGDLKWYHHHGFVRGRAEWDGPKAVGTGWNGFKHVFAGGVGVLYAIDNSGNLRWYRHRNFMTGDPSFDGPKQVGTGWQNFKHVFAGGGGVIYAIEPDGVLKWYRHHGYLDGGTGWEGPRVVGHGWHTLKDVFAGGAGAIYGIENGGRLRWYRHDGYVNGERDWKGPKLVGHGWHVFKDVFGGGAGVIYGIEREGTIRWYRHHGYIDGSREWTGNAKAGTDWHKFKSVMSFTTAFLNLDSVDFAVHNDSEYTIYVKPENQREPVAVRPGGVYDGRHDGIAVPHQRPGKVYKTRDFANATVNKDGSVTSDFPVVRLFQHTQSVNEKSGEWLDSPPDDGWNATFEASRSGTNTGGSQDSGDSEGREPLDRDEIGVGDEPIFTGDIEIDPQVPDTA